MTEPPIDPAAELIYEDALRRARIRATFRRIQRRDAQARFLAAVPRSSAIDLSAVEQQRRGQG